MEKDLWASTLKQSLQPHYPDSSIVVVPDEYDRKELLPLYITPDGRYRAHAVTHIWSGAVIKWGVDIPMIQTPLTDAVRQNGPNIPRMAILPIECPANTDTFSQTILVWLPARDA